MTFSNSGDHSPETINFMSFNQDSSCISVGSTLGYKIYNCDPFGKCFNKNDGGMGIVEMLFCTSLVAVVGMGDRPALSPRRLKIINTKRQSTICELTFPTAVLAVKLNRKRLVVLLEEQIYIYDISNMKLLHTIETASNPQAVAALSPSSENCYFVYPSPGPSSTLSNDPMNNNNTRDKVNGGAGSATRTGEVIIMDALSLQPVNVIEAHKSPLSFVAMNAAGTLIATASDKGTIIRVFSIPDGKLMNQFRRGSYASKIFSMGFDHDSALLVVSSATGTIHIFRLGGQGGISLGESIGDEEVGNYGGSEDLYETGSESSLIPRSNTDSASKLDAFIEAKRRNGGSMASLFRRSSQTLGRSVAGAMGNYLPKGVSQIWEPTRDFAYIKLPHVGGNKLASIPTTATTNVIDMEGATDEAGTKSTTTTVGGNSVKYSISPSVVAISGSLNSISSSNNGGGSTTTTEGGVYVMVVTLDGYFYQYAIDTIRGGECELVRQYSLLDNAS
ncbi:WD40 repeat-like protein [Nadsonia fulvescens var. elongata DSM 6958]|uniref:Autophagy-related protein 18 n=1 Tax=Nadsonia fulvescens var. elongata DSM 6958 TaxID=857566 RepID=A0A1E3PKV4_9ASCO|nr:WD40 repeat-like protein [Nadsonia fulvescens var. elongata DSM 6958]